MFDVGILELFIVAVMALLVLGPERLPKAARQAGRWLGYAKRSASRWSAEINRQLENEELAEQLKKSKTLEDVKSPIKSFDQAISDSLKGQSLGAQREPAHSAANSHSGSAAKKMPA